uniref:Cystatin domain-containing protein n=1 Tax=Strongyloides stercoralis TaxID=6248 RepID=A0A0K0DZ76_STRER
MNSKIILLLCLITTFLTVLSFAKSSKSIKWTPVKYTDSKIIYNFAGSAAIQYFVKQRKRGANDIEVCLVSKVSKQGKKYKLSFIANAKDCKRSDIGDDCWQKLEATVTLQSKSTFTIDNYLLDELYEMLSLKRMNSKLIELLFLIAVFLTACSFEKFLEVSKSLKWIPVKHTESGNIYNFADSAARHYFVKQRKREANEIEVCKVTKVIKNGKKYRLSFIANAKNCTDDMKDDCWQRLQANITVKNKYIFTIVNVTKINNKKHEKSKCQFPQFNWDKF